MKLASRQRVRSFAIAFAVIAAVLLGYFALLTGLPAPVEDTIRQYRISGESRIVIFEREMSRRVSIGEPIEDAHRRILGLGFQYNCLARAPCDPNYRAYLCVVPVPLRLQVQPDRWEVHVQTNESGSVSRVVAGTGFDSIL